MVDKHNLQQYITYCFVEGCCERCADATLEEESPPLHTITLELFLKRFGGKKKK